MTSTARLNIDYLSASQSQKHVTVNEGLRKLDAIVQLAVASSTTAAQPGSPADGDCYILPAGKTGAAWGPMTNLAIAYYVDGAWMQLTPHEGWLALVKDTDLLLYYTGAAWSLFPVAKLLTFSATDRIAGRATAGAGAAEEITCTAAGRALIDDANAAAQRATLGNASTAQWFRGDGTISQSLTSNSTNSTYIELANTAASGKTYAFFSSGGGPMAAGGFGVFDSTAGAQRMSIYTDGGVTFGAPTGGSKGDGTLNAKAVYDDNTLLTCYVFDQALDGAASLQKWDGKVPDRLIPPRVDLASGAVIEAERTEPRAHGPLRKFASRIGTPHDPLTLDGYARHWKEKRHLTSMPNEAAFDPAKNLSTGEWVQRLVETVEIQAVLIDQLNQRLKAVEAGRGR